MIAIELLSWQVAFALDRVQITGALPHLVAAPILPRPVIPKILQKELAPVLVQDLLLFATHHQVTLLLKNCRRLRVVAGETHHAVGAAYGHLVDT